MPQSSWKREEKPSPNLQFGLTVALKIDSAPRAALEEFFWQVSDPKHASYGKYKTNADITKMLAVPGDRVQRVADFFKKSGANVSVGATRDTLDIKMPVWALEAALQTEVSWFRHSVATKAPRVLRASTGYSLPSEVASDVSMVGELLQFPRPRQNPDKGLVEEIDAPNANGWCAVEKVRQVRYK